MVASRATAQAARRFLDALQERTPFPVRAIQVDGGVLYNVLVMVAFAAFFVLIASRTVRQQVD